MKKVKQSLPILRRCKRCNFTKNICECRSYEGYKVTFRQLNYRMLHLIPLQLKFEIYYNRLKQTGEESHKSIRALRKNVELPRNIWTTSQTFQNL